MRPPLLRLAALGLALACSIPPARASVADALSLDDLVTRAETVVVARARSARSRWDGPNRIVTDVQLEVETSAKGTEGPGATLEVVCLGGAVDGIGMHVEGAPRFRVGSASLVFAAHHEDGFLVPVGMAQGVMPIEERGADRLVHPGGEGLALVRRGASGRLERARAALGAPRPLEDVLAEIRDMVRGTR